MRNHPKCIPVKGFENYSISEAGVLQKNNKALYTKSNVAKNKHIKCSLIANNERHTKYIHRLVAEHFLPNPENKRFIFHCNGKKYDNRVENLEWVTAYELIEYSKANRKLEKLIYNVIKNYKPSIGVIEKILITTATI